MIQKIIFALLLLLSIKVTGQKQRYLSVAAFTTQSDYPFGKFAGLFKETFHPGFEIGYGKILKPRLNHEWLMELKLAYFYHRFIQHGLPFYLNFGYRYKFNSRISAETSLGAGYMHSIPATEKFKLNDNSEYVNNKGIGRAQATASFGIGLNYFINPQYSNPVRLFTVYEQRVQMPFVKSYVPFLPYNTFMIGASRSIKKRNSSSK